MCAYQEVRNVCFSKILACFAFLKHPFEVHPFDLFRTKSNEYSCNYEKKAILIATHIKKHIMTYLSLPLKDSKTICLYYQKT